VVAAVVSSRGLRLDIQLTASGFTSTSTVFLANYKYALYSSPGGLLSAAVLHAPSLAIASLYGLRVAGLYALTQRLLMIPLATLGQSASEVMITRVAELRRAGDMEASQRLFKKVLVVATCGGVVVVGVLALAAPTMFKLAFGSKWSEAGAYVRLMSPMFAAALAAVPFGGIPEVFGRAELFLARESIRASLIGVALLSASLFALQPESALVAIGAAGAVGYLLSIHFAWQSLRGAVLVPDSVASRVEESLETE
jgi:O-antigen/teichoic acid export membrane protein